MTAPSWDAPLEGESGKAFEAFCTYRDMGNERSVRRAAQKLGKNCTTINQWSSKWGWVSRAAQYDVHVDRQQRQAREAAIRDMNARYAQMARATSSKLVQRLQSLNPDELSANQLAATLKALHDVESKALGVNDRIEVEMVANSPEWQRIKGAVLEALLPHPAALGAVLAALNEVE